MRNINITWLHIVLLLFGVALLLAACQKTETNSAQTEATPIQITATDTSIPTETPTPLATPYAQIPVAGICLEATSNDTVEVALWPDMPMPRCQEVLPEQLLQVANHTDDTLLISLGDFERRLEPGEAVALDKPFGSYLAPGVHRLQVSLYSGPELFLITGD